MKTSVRFNRVVFLLVGFLLGWAIMAQADVTGRINFQGRLTDTSGFPVQDDTYQMTFSIYASSTGGSSIWSETQNVATTDGIYSVVLGLINEIDPDDIDGNRYLGVKVGSDSEMTPRQLLTAVPFSFKAADSERLSGQSATDFAAADHGHSFTEITGTVTDGQVPNTITINHASTAGDADTVDGQHASAFAPTTHTHSATQITSGTLSNARYSARSDLSTEGYLGNAAGDIAQNNGTLQSTLNADLLDGLSSSAFMSASTDNWVNEAGDTMSGRLEVTQNLMGSGWGESIKGILNTEYTGAGVYGISGGPNAYGVAGGATGANAAGVYGEATGTSASGVKGYATGTNGIGVYGEGPSWAGYFDGNLFASGTVGIGTTNPTESKVHVVGDLKVAGDDGWDSNGDEAVIGLGNILGHFFIKAVYGDGLKLGAYATTDAFVLKQISGNVGIGTASPTSKLDVNGTTTTKVLVITGGADLSENFDVSPAGREIRPGMVVSINPDQPGELMVSHQAYDRKVAGIISGAGDVQPGLHMGHQGTQADGEYPVALTGRVYCWADASQGSIQPGDLLTTSNTPGHVMRVTDYEKAQGATLGKAMSTVEKGQGLVLVLVGLQ